MYGVINDKIINNNYRMNQKTLEDEGDGYREKGSNLFPGKIMKGTLNEAPIKIKVSSIPAKH